jgi:transposase
MLPLGISVWQVGNSQWVGAHLVFADESGFFLNPLVRRAWAVAGQTPILPSRGRSYQHLSAVGAIAISPRRCRLRLLLRLHPDQAINQDKVVEFLQQLLRHLPGPIVLLWDRLPAHRGARVKKFVASHPRLHLEYFPPYAPEYDPVEYLLSWLKTYPLANRCASDLDQLTDVVLNGSEPLFTNQRLLRSFVHAAQLPIKFPTS